MGVPLRLVLLLVATFSACAVVSSFRPGQEGLQAAVPPRQKKHWHGRQCTSNERLLVVVPDALMGITNQLMTFMNGIFLGIATNRSICLGGFYGHLYTEEDSKKMWAHRLPSPPLIPPGLILDMEHLSQLFEKELGDLSICSCHLHTMKDLTCVVTATSYDSGGYCKMQRHRQMEQNIREVITPKLDRFPDHKKAIMTPPVVDIQRVIVGCPWQLFSNDYAINMDPTKPRLKFLTAIRYKSVFYDLVDEQLRAIFHFSPVKVGSPFTAESIINYTVIHLRAENDFIRHYNYQLRTDVTSCNFLDQFVTYIRQVITDPQTNIVVQTGLKASDDLSFAISYLKQFFPNLSLLDKDALIRRVNEPMLRTKVVENGISQVEAIFDLVVIEKAEMFVGLKQSTFSMLSATKLSYQNKRSYLFDFKKPDSAGFDEYKMTDNFQQMRAFKNAYVAAHSRDDRNSAVAMH